MKKLLSALAVAFTCMTGAASAATYQVDNLINGGGYSVVHDIDYSWGYVFTEFDTTVDDGGLWEDNGDIAFSGTASDVDFGDLTYTAYGNINQASVSGWITFDFVLESGSHWVETFYFADMDYYPDPSGPNGFYDGVITLWGDNKCDYYDENGKCCYHYGVDLKIAVSEVPLPASSLLLLGGMGAFAALRRKRKS